MEDDKFIQSVRMTLTARIRADEEKRKKERRETEVREFQSPRDWTRLKAWLQQAVAEVNQGLPAPALLFEEHAKDRFFVRYAVGQRRKELKIEYRNILGGSITITEKEHSLLHLESIVLDNRLQWICPTDDSDRRFDVERLGMHIIGLLIAE